MSKQEIHYDANFEDIAHSPTRPPILQDNLVKIAGKLGLEGETFINETQTKLIHDDLKQAIHIKNFIRESILKLNKKFHQDKQGLLSEFCDDQHIFQELEEKNQLDIKGGSNQISGTTA